MIRGSVAQNGVQGYYEFNGIGTRNSQEKRGKKIQRWLLSQGGVRIGAMLRQKEAER